jgi:transposase
MPQKRSAKRKSLSSLPAINLNAAGVDIGGSEHWVAVPQDRDRSPVRRFATFTTDLYRLADWLAQCGIDTVAMEATGVYWIPLYEILEARGFEVRLVDARKTKNVAGRKSDVLDCQWIQQLHTFGLLAGAFRPDEQTARLRTFVRQRKMLVDYAASHIQHIQKSLTLMNLLLHTVVSDVVGATGMRILRAILAGERDPATLAALRDYRCKATEQEIEQSLTGTWREEHLFALRQAVELFDTYQQKIADCDREIERLLRSFDPKAHRSALPPSSKTKRKLDRNSPAFDLRELLFETTGIDLTQIGGVGPYSVLQFLSEVGTDMTRWPTPKHFASWLGLCPGTKISGGKRLDPRPRDGRNRAAQVLRMAASSLRSSKCSLGAFFRRKAARFGAPKAITITAHKLARIIYALLKTGTTYVDPGAHVIEERHRNRVLRNLTRTARDLGFQLVPITPTPGLEGAVT